VTPRARLRSDRRNSTAKGRSESVQSKSIKSSHQVAKGGYDVADGHLPCRHSDPSTEVIARMFAKSAAEVLKWHTRPASRPASEHAKAWDDHRENLRNFFLRYGHTSVSSKLDTIHYPMLGWWVQQQRAA
jgi:hypothetical protein